MAKVLLEARKLRKQFGTSTILDDLSFFISEKQKIALIGRNGAGKSTLINILIGDEEQDSGELLKHSSAYIGIIRQHEVLPGEISTLAYLVASSDKPEWRVKKVCAQFELIDEKLDLTPQQLSGGYQMRVKLVAMLLQEPNLLILDEPINYLDLQTLILLEQFLQRYNGAFLIAAHDRTFLENTCTSVFEVEHGEIHTYKGRVSEYLTFKHEQLKYQLRHNKKLTKEIAHQQQFVDRFRFKSKLASRAQSKVKHIAKLKRRISKINADLAKTKITIPSSYFTKGIALTIKDLHIGYDKTTIAQYIDFEINRGDKIVIAGENGQGKSTLLKTLAGKLEPLDGKLKWWHKAQIQYYDQHTERTLKKSESVLDYLTRMAPKETSGEAILMMAGNFLFQGEALDKNVNVLSGGERARLCLSGILLNNHNVLLLDEPTNHLDVETVEALATALKEYEGTVIFISHARTFVNEIADRVLEIRNGTLRRYVGSYEDYVDDLENLALEVASEAPSQKDGEKLNRAEEHRQVREHQRAQQKLEKAITELETEKSKILAFFFERPTEYHPKKSMRLKEIDDELEKREGSWLAHENTIEEIRATE